MNKVKCLIIGSGPAGYTAAIYAARADLKPVMYTGLQMGGQLTTTTEVDNFPGYPNGTGGTAMMSDLQNQAERFGTKINFGLVTKVQLSDKFGGTHKIVIDESKEIEAETVIISTGATAKYLGLGSEQRLIGGGVSACATCDGFFYKGQNVIVTDTGKLLVHFNRGLQVGQQYGPTLDGEGGFNMTNDGRIAISKLFMEKNVTTPMDYTPDLDFNNPVEAVFSQDQINCGVLNFKWEFDPNYGNGNSAVDVPLYRLGGMYCMRAEAYFRKGDVALALADINKLRTNRTREALFGNAPGKPILTLDETTLYNEIGFEMYWEMYRRKQMIRFGTYDKAYTAKSETSSYLRVYAIPQATIDVTAQITQNIGY